MNQPASFQCNIGITCEHPSAGRWPSGECKGCTPQNPREACTLFVTPMDVCHSYPSCICGTVYDARKVQS